MAIMLDIAPPADMPPTNTRRRSTCQFAISSRVVPATIEGSPTPRRCCPSARFGAEGGCCPAWERLVIADDLTGAADTGVQLTSLGSPVYLKEYDDPECLRQALQRERAHGCRIVVVCDASSQGHLDQIALLEVQGAGRLLPVGSAAALVGRLSSSATPECPPPPVMKRLLLVCGTGSQVTRRQLDALLERHPGMHRKLQPQWLIAASAHDRRRSATELVDAWHGGVMALTIRPFGAGAPNRYTGAGRCRIGRTGEAGSGDHLRSRGGWAAPVGRRDGRCLFPCERRRGHRVGVRSAAGARARPMAGRCGAWLSGGHQGWRIWSRENVG